MTLLWCWALRLTISQPSSEISIPTAIIYSEENYFLFASGFAHAVWVNMSSPVLTRPGSTAV